MWTLGALAGWAMPAIPAADAEATVVPAHSRGPLGWVQQPTAFIKTVADEVATGSTRELFDIVRNDDGTLDNIMSIHSVDPFPMRAHHDLYVTVCRADSLRLSRVEREIVGVAVSAENGCKY